MLRNVPRGSLCFIDIIFSLIIGLGCIFSVRILMWFLSNTLKENISNLLLQPQFGLVKTVVASASHCSSEKAGTDIGTGILTMPHVRGNRSGVQRRPQGWRAECAFGGTLWKEGEWHWHCRFLGDKKKKPDPGDFKCDLGQVVRDKHHRFGKNGFPFCGLLSSLHRPCP